MILVLLVICSSAGFFHGESRRNAALLFYFIARHECFIFIITNRNMVISAGILAYRKTERGIEVLLCHPGGPFFKNKDLGSWTIPKGLVDAGEDELQAAQREFKEEVGVGLSEDSEYIALKPVKLRSGKIVHAWAVLADLEIKEVSSNKFMIEWPPRSGKFVEFPEVDRAEWYGIEEAKEKLNTAQVALVEELVGMLE
jgi:predicted NUDIX family NTP pyrophosphohydrolase